MEKLYVSKNLSALADLLVRTWRTQAVPRAKRLAGRNPRGVKLLSLVSARVKE